MTDTHFAESRNTGGRTPLAPFDRVMGLLLLLPGLNSSLREPAADRRGADRGVPELSLATSMVGYASDTGEFRGSIHQVSGQMFLDSLSPARVQVTVPITPRGLMPERAAVREPMDDRPLEARRVSSMTLAAREFQPLTRANGAGGEGIMAGTLQLDGVERPVRIPISFAVDGPMLQGQGQFDVNLADFDATPPGRQLDCRDDITMEVFLIATTQ